MIRNALLALLAAIAISPAPAAAQSAQEFAIQQWQPQDRDHRVKRPHAQRYAAPRNDISVGLFIGGSWLQANLGASRPHGAPGAWCGYAMRLEVKAMGRSDPGPAYDMARKWCDFGSPAPIGAVGSIFVSRGHVSRVVAGSCPPGSVATISGNATGRRVSIMCEPISRAICSRWP